MSSSVSAMIIRRAGPPTRRVVYRPARAAPAGAVGHLKPAQLEIDHGSARPQHLLIVAQRLDSHGHPRTSIDDTVAEKAISAPSASSAPQPAW